MQLIAAGKMVHLAPTRITAHVRARTGRPFNALDNPLRRLRDPGSHTLTAPLKPAGRAMTRLLPPSIRTDISRDANRHREQAHDVSMSLSSVYREVRQVRITSAGQEKQAHNRTAPPATTRVETDLRREGLRGSTRAALAAQDGRITEKSPGPALLSAPIRKKKILHVADAATIHTGRAAPKAGVDTQKLGSSIEASHRSVRYPGKRKQLIALKAHSSRETMNSSMSLSR